MKIKRHGDNIFIFKFSKHLLTISSGVGQGLDGWIYLDSLKWKTLSIQFHVYEFTNEIIRYRLNVFGVQVFQWHYYL